MLVSYAVVQRAMPQCQLSSSFLHNQAWLVDSFTCLFTVEEWGMTTPLPHIRYGSGCLGCVKHKKDQICPL